MLLSAGGPAITFYGVFIALTDGVKLVSLFL